MCLISFYSVVLTQENSIINDGIYVRVLSQYNNLAGDIEGHSNINADASVIANIKGSLGLGVAFGYRAHGKGPIDGSAEISYTSSQHQVEYHYPSLSSITFGANPLSGSDTLGINSVSFSSISFQKIIYNLILHLVLKYILIKSI